MNEAKMKIQMMRLRRKMREVYPRLIEARRKVEEIERVYAELSDEYHRLDRILSEKRTKILPSRGTPRRMKSPSSKEDSFVRKIKELLRSNRTEEARTLLTEALGFKTS